MRIFEVEGPSEREIISLFLRQQDIPRDYIEYEVIDEGSKGVLGLGKRNAKLRIKYNDAEHLKRRARTMLADLLEKAGFSDVHISVTQKDNRVTLDIATEERPDLLIGKMAQTLDSIQYIMDKMLNIDDASGVEIIIDVGSYRGKAVDDAVEKAIKMAEQVKISGRPAKLPPMPTLLRKAVHIALKNLGGVTTVSLGEGQVKQINIVPDKKS